MEPMTGIEPAYSAWEVDPARPWLSRYIRKLAYQQDNIHVSPRSSRQIGLSCDIERVGSDLFVPNDTTSGLNDADDAENV
jgi:hypothetical protein